MYINLHPSCCPSLIVSVETKFVVRNFFFLADLILFYFFYMILVAIRVMDRQIDIILIHNITTHGSIDATNII